MAEQRPPKIAVESYPEFLHRQQVSSAMDFMRDGDVLLVWRHDRLGRSLPQSIEVIAGLDAGGIGFRSLAEAIDSTTPGGCLIFHVLGALGQFNRDLIRERTKAGLSAAAVRGRKGARKPVVTADKLQKARTLLEQGLHVRAVSTRLKIGKTALYDALRGTGACCRGPKIDPPVDTSEITGSEATQPTI